MLSESLVQQIIRFHGEQFPVVSFYLNVDAGQNQPLSAYKIAAKDLIKEIRTWIKNHEEILNREQLNSLNEDIEKIQTIINKISLPIMAQGYALFSCSGKGFWQEVFLPLPVKNMVMIGTNPFVRPLSNILDQYKRYGLCMVDRSRMLVAEVLPNEVTAMEEMTEPIPKKVRYGGWQGYAESHIQRHVEEHVYSHLKHSATFATEFFKNRTIERLIIIAPPPVLNYFEEFLPDVLRRKIIARFPLDIFTNNKKEVVNIVRKINDSLREEEEQSLVEKIITERERTGNAVLGLDETLRAVTQGAVLTLAVAEDYTEPGYRCFTCHQLSREQTNCPICQKPLKPEPDIIDEIIEEALRRGAIVKHLRNKELAAKIHQIAALLRFKISS